MNDLELNDLILARERVLEADLDLLLAALTDERSAAHLADLADLAAMDVEASSCALAFEKAVDAFKGSLPEDLSLEISWVEVGEGHPVLISPSSLTQGAGGREFRVNGHLTTCTVAEKTAWTGEREITFWRAYARYTLEIEET